MDNAKSGQGDELVYRKVTGLTSDLHVQTNPDLLDLDNPEEASDVDSENDESVSNDDVQVKQKYNSSARPRDESPESKKARKKAVKEAAAEKRKTKVPKHVKKRKEKEGSKK